jgi:hypothetical protein
VRWDIFEDRIRRRFLDTIAHFERMEWQIRNGILHQGEVKGNARVVITRSAPVVRLTDDGRGIVVNRRRFHREMERYIDDYVAQLRDPANTDLRRKFRRKMNYICRLPTIPA